MKRSIQLVIVAYVIVVLFGPLGLQAQTGPVYKPGEYPAPRYPQVKPNYTMEELVQVAREVVRRPYMAAFLKAGYNIQKGHRALIVVPGSFDERVMGALVRAIQEAGGRADVVRTYSPLPPAGEAPGIERAEREAMGLLGGSGGFGGGDAGFTRTKVMNLAETGGYNVLIYGSGGTHPALKIPWQYIFWDQIDKFVTAAAFPDEVQVAIDKTAWELVTSGVRFHATDPEGTDISWTVKPQAWEEAKATYKEGTGNPGFNIVHEGHMSPIPLGMAVDSFMQSDATGVIAGTLNHAGPFPHIRVSINKASASGVEGGGKYGEVWREALSKWKDLQLPGHPGTGVNKLWEVAIGTNVKGIRAKSFERDGGSWERSRSGVIHWGMGSRSGFVMGVQMPKEYADFQEEHPEAPGGHVHIHTYFNTLEVEKANGQKVLLINKGRLTVLDDPRVRQAAAKYGNPDELLQEIWIPAMPGINLPGVYMRDYGSNPVAYIRKDMAANYKY